MFYSQPDLGLSSVTARCVLVSGENPFWVAFHPNPAFGLISGDGQMWACFQLYPDLCWHPISTVLVSSHPDGLVSNPDLGLSPITRRLVFWSLGHIQIWACFSATTGFLLVPKRSDTHYSALGADGNSCDLTFDFETTDDFLFIGGSSSLLASDYCLQRKVFLDTACTSFTSSGLGLSDYGHRHGTAVIAVTLLAVDGGHGHGH